MTIGRSVLTVNRYTIRYRCDDPPGTSLIVQDGEGTAYLFSDGVLQLRLGGDEACARLARLMGRHAPWAMVPEVPPYTLEGLRRLTRAPEARVGGYGAWHVEEDVEVLRR